MALSASKICTKCKEDKCLSAYSYKNKAKTRLRTWCKECNNKHTRENKHKYKQTHLKSQKKYYQNNRGYYRYQLSKYRSCKLYATPQWLSSSQIKDIIQIYKDAKSLEWLNNEPIHVDHIIPLQGKNVCGLHVPWNLQLLTASKNFSKGNKV